MFIYFVAIRNILRAFGIFYDHSVHFVFIWYIFSGFGIMHQEKSGSPRSVLATLRFLASATHCPILHCVFPFDRFLCCLFVIQPQSNRAIKATFRVTRLGNYSPIGWQFAFG
jgi:hypothetical protein